MCDLLWQRKASDWLLASSASRLWLLLDLSFLSQRLWSSKKICSRFLPVFSELIFKTVSLNSVQYAATGDTEDREGRGHRGKKGENAAETTADFCKLEITKKRDIREVTLFHSQTVK